MGDVFISFSTVDRQQARVLAEALEGHGFSVWWQPKLGGGEAYEEPVRQALRDAKAAIVIWSESSVQSPWVGEEARQARSQGKLIGAKVPGLRATDIPREFRTLPVEPVDSKDRILHAVERLAGPPGRSAISAGGDREPAERAEGQRQAFAWPISANTFSFAIIVAAFVMGWYGISLAFLVAGIVGAFVGGAALESTGWEIDVSRAAMAMATGAILAAILARFLGLA